jgi:hypothetical protein
MYAAVPRTLPASVAWFDKVGEFMALSLEPAVGLTALARPKSSTITNRQGLSEWHGTPSDPLREIFTINEFEDQCSDAIGLIEAMNLRDVWMIERREHLRFATEPGETIDIVSDPRQQNLDRDVASQLRIAGAIDLSHAAGTQRPDNFIGAEACAGA